jgi:hypothetical protein
VFIKKESIYKIRNRMKKESRHTSVISDAKLEYCPKEFYPPEVVAFTRAFRDDPIMARTTTGGTTAARS